MNHRRTPRAAHVLAVVAAVSGLLAPSSAYAAETWGKVGRVNLSDPGAIAKQGDDGQLAFIKVYRPSIFGRYDFPTWVGWRFTILNRTDSGKPWRTVFSSSEQKDQASTGKPADDFSSRQWTAPDDPSGVYRVRLTAYFYEPYSRMAREGRYQARLNVLCQLFVGGNFYCAEIPSDDW